MKIRAIIKSRTSTEQLKKLPQSTQKEFKQMFDYVANFNLTDEINEKSFDDAVDYLQEDEEIQAGFEEDIV